MDLHRIKRIGQFDTAGWIAVTSILLCVLSGVLLAIPYDFTRAYLSVSELVLFNPAGTFVRNLHYWSAQLFFVFTLLHLYDHLKKSTETNIKSKGTWLLLTLVVAILGYEMISGFILKGDAGGIQARRIVASMLGSVPFAGKMLSSAFTGAEDNWQIIYIQHVSTGTILLLIGISDHIKTIWPRPKTFTIVFAFLLLISLIFRAPLGQVESSQIKGPWFFVGIQEMLHYTSHPGYILTFFGVLVLLLFALPQLLEKPRTIIKKILLAMSILYLMMTFSVFLFRGENWQWRDLKDLAESDEPVLIFDPVNLFKKINPVILPENQKAEGCLTCHSAMTGLSESHNPKIIGCYSCHKGDPFTTDKLTAHRKMVTVPGNFSNAGQTCGTQNCHQEIAGRMLSSLMTTQSGIIGVDKFVFGETPSPDQPFHVKNLGFSAADMHLRNLCAGCHLGNEKLRTGNAVWLERGGGCNACHLHYNDQALASMKRMQTNPTDSKNEIHPTIDIQVSDDRCRSCHSRSGRISLNYEGWNETTLKASEITDSLHFKVLPDDRVVEFVQADIHQQKGMACIDCHGSYEIMGDGNNHLHKEEAVNVQCVDCHPSADGKPNWLPADRLPDRESQLIAWLRKSDIKSRMVVTAKGTRPLINTRVDSLNRLSLIGKLDGKRHPMKPLSPLCIKGKGHKRLSCESCHTAWVPQCIGCHNEYEKNTEGFDLLTNKQVRGTWVEFAGKSFARAPVLGVNEKNAGKIVTAMPGMVMTIDRKSFGEGSATSFHRLYAPASGHTTVREGRSCKSCHNSSLAIGYGDGALNYKISGTTGKWIFEPRFTLSKQDALPEDAWTGFLMESQSPNSTRTGLRPFTVKEQKRILEAGSCLTCHNEKSKVMEFALEDFEQTVARRTKSCIFPSW